MARPPGMIAEASETATAARRKQRCPHFIPLANELISLNNPQNISPASD